MLIQCVILQTSTVFIKLVFRPNKINYVFLVQLSLMFDHVTKALLFTALPLLSNKLFC